MVYTVYNTNVFVIIVVLTGESGWVEFVKVNLNLGLKTKTLAD